MSRTQIKLGYEINTGKEVSIKESHLIVTGLTQEAGKTTTLEALIKRSKKRAIVFRTKIGEKSFVEGTKIPPYFKDRSDWQFIQGLVEATIKEKLRSFERAKIIQICKKTSGNSILEFKKEVDKRLGEKINSFELDILTNLQAYLEIVIPKLQSIDFSNELELVEGLNIMDLERFSRDPEVQSLIIGSVAEEVLHKFKDVILVIPEAWKFLPQKRGNPCKQIIEEFIRQGATNKNFIWIDSQDMADVDKAPLKQIANWILGYQSERNEVKHTLDQIPLPKGKKPKPEDIMGLGTGVFYLATREKTQKVYVEPTWLDSKRAKQIALGKLKISELDAPENIAPFKVAIKKEKVTAQPTIDFSETTKRFNKELNEMRTDFFNKIGDVQEQITNIHSEVYNLKNQPKEELDEETLINKVLQKMPTPEATSQTTEVNTEAIIKEVLARVPQQAGSVTYKIAPLKKIQKDFLEECKTKILSDITSLSDDGKKALKYLESRGIGIKANELIIKCFLIKEGGSARGRVSKIFQELNTIEVIKRDTGGKNFPKLRDRIKELLETHKATEQEIDQVYNHILMEMLK